MKQVYLRMAELLTTAVHHCLGHPVFPEVYTLVSHLEKSFRSYLGALICPTPTILI